jgi:hypothetical protein
MFDNNGTRVTADHFSQPILEPVFFPGKQTAGFKPTRII